MESRHKAVIKWVLRLAFSLGLLSWLLARTELGTIWDVISRFSVEMILLLIAIYMLGVVISTLKWRLLVSGHNFYLLFRLSLIGQFYSLVLPGQIAGEAVKAYRLGKGHRDAETVAASVLLDKVTGLISLLLLALIGLYLSHLQVPRALLISVTLVLFIILVIFFLGRIKYFIRIPQVIYGYLESRFHGPHRFITQLRFFTEAWLAYLKQPWYLIGSVLMGFCFQFVHILIILLIASKIGVSLALAEWLWVFALVSVAVLLPLTVGGIGVREGAFVAILGFLGVPSTSALVISLTIFGLQIIAASMGAFFEVIGVKRRSA